MNLCTKHKRVLLKISGEALASPLPCSDNSKQGLDGNVLSKLVEDIRAIYDQEIQIAIVVGGGNIFRGVKGVNQHGLKRSTSDYMGMLATVINGLAIQQYLNNAGIPCRAMSAIPMPSVCEPYTKEKAIHHLEKKRVVILTAGTGNPYFTTDSGAALRACELECDLLLKATKVAGIYTKDPMKFNDAEFLPKITYDEALDKKYEIMDAAAFALVREQQIPIVIFSLYEDNPFAKAICGEGQFTIVTR